MLRDTCGTQGSIRMASHTNGHEAESVKRIMRRKFAVITTMTRLVRGRKINSGGKDQHAAAGRKVTAAVGEGLGGWEELGKQR